MKNYTVKWSINVNAENEQEAAQIALEIQRDKNSMALYFDVKEDNSNQEVMVNLMTYYTLLQFDPDLKKWVPLYGSYDYQDCIYEMDDYKDNDIEKLDYQIIKTLEDQASITEAICAINKGVK